MRFRLIYNHKNLSKPILAEAILKTKVLINILEAKVTPTAGEIMVDVPVEGEKLREVIRFFEDAGVTVKEVAQILEIDMGRCMGCGACVSPCPTQALKLTKDWEIEFDEKKCVRCMICVDACPVKAIKFT
ncbi:MAG: ferredoxin [Candidatus Hecatellales archaeon]|nr:MAG: ferredoxin [Candidatus Hecatellales archaeon]